MSASNSGSSGSSGKGGDGASEVEPEPQEALEEQPAREVSGTELESAAGTLSKQDAESFWDKATERPSDTGPIDESTLSWDEAQKRGLLDEEDE